MKYCMTGADLSPCGKYRYTLLRSWVFDGSILMFIGLNPSTADPHTDDPTIRRMVSFARAHGYGAVRVCNLFAYRATNPNQLRRVAEPTGPDNDKWLQKCVAESDEVVAAWGARGNLMGRADAIREMIPEMLCLGVTKSGEPKHPLYLPAATNLRKYEVEG